SMTGLSPSSVTTVPPPALKDSAATTGSLSDMQTSCCCSPKPRSSSAKTPKRLPCWMKCASVPDWPRTLSRASNPHITVNTQHFLTLSCMNAASSWRSRTTVGSTWSATTVPTHWFPILRLKARPTMETHNYQISKPRTVISRFRLTNTNWIPNGCTKIQAIDYHGSDKAPYTL